jgi:phosphatidylserine decarboxylase
MIAREGWPFILVGVVVSAIFWGLYLLRSDWVFLIAALDFTLLTLFVIYFFRDPPRRFTAEPNLLVSPADGKIIAVEKVPDHPFIGGDALKVAIFLSIFDVHINRVPASGRIEYVRYHPGRFISAFKDKASELNEQTEIGLTTDTGYRIIVKQIAGVIARRIVCRLRPGDTVGAGARFGLIRFGSRVELLLPAGTRLLVSRGVHVKGGHTPIGRLPEASATVAAAERAEGDDAEL